MLSSMLILSRPSIIAISLISQHTSLEYTATNPPASARPADHVKVVARLRRRVWVDSFHELAEDHQRGQAADPAAIEREQAELVVGHGQRAAAAVGEVDFLVLKVLGRREDEVFGSSLGRRTHRFG